MRDYQIIPVLIGIWLEDDAWQWLVWNGAVSICLAMAKKRYWVGAKGEWQEVEEETRAVIN